MQKIVTSLWFDDQAEKAANYYVSIFPNSRIQNVTRYGSAGPRPEGLVMTVDFQLAGQEFNAINGGPDFTFTEATSLLVNCQTQEEVDDLWDKLGKGGEPGPCGWLKDRYGLSWQIVPVALNEMIADPDPEKSQRVMAAMLQMGKLDEAALRDAYEGRVPARSASRHPEPHGHDHQEDREEPLHQGGRRNDRDPGSHPGAQGESDGQQQGAPHVHMSAPVVLDESEDPHREEHGAERSAGRGREGELHDAHQPDYHDDTAPDPEQAGEDPGCRAERQVEEGHYGLLVRG